MDLHMPVMDGIQATLQIKAREEFNSIPIVGLSADAFTDKQNEAMNKGFADYLTKPLNLNKLIPILNKYLILEPGAELKKFENPLNMDQQLFQTLDPELRNELMQIFNVEMPILIKKMNEAIKVNDYEAISRHAHYIKGGALNIAASEIVGICNQLEKQSKVKNHDSIIKLISLLRSSYEQTQGLNK